LSTLSTTINLLRAVG